MMLLGPQQKMEVKSSSALCVRAPRLEIFGFQGVRGASGLHFGCYWEGSVVAWAPLNLTSGFENLYERFLMKRALLG